METFRIVNYVPNNNNKSARLSVTGFLFASIKSRGDIRTPVK